MLNGKEFGKAIAEAIDLKLQNGSVASKAAIARHFGMKPPSLVDWVKKGSVSKAKLPELWRYFSDVVGPEHWGLSIREWPSGLSGSVDTKSRSIDEKNTPTVGATGVFQSARDRQINELVKLAMSMSEEGVSIAIYEMRKIASQYPIAKQTPEFTG